MNAVAVGWIYSVAVALVLSLAALAAESGLRSVGRAGRFAWLGAMALSLMVPAAAWLGLNAWSAPVAVFPAAFAPIELDAVVAGASSAGGMSSRALLGLVWGTLSLLLVARLGVGLVRLRAARVKWRPLQVSGVPVLVTEDVGPAVFGLHPAAILLPSWALSMDEDLRALMLLHEREHVRAGDPWLLAAALSAVVVMPWNPLLWVQLHRLRLAVEMDCDARVLRRAPDAGAYGRLLLEVGRRGPATVPVLALSEPITFLERRIRAFTRRAGPHAARRALVLGSMAFALGLLAVCVRDPLSPGLELPAEAVASEEPAFTPFTVKPDLKNPAQVAAALRRNYPPLLRDAGIAGTTVLWFHIGADGTVLKTTLKESSGYPALDESAVRVAELMEFTPALNAGRPTAVWLQIPLTFASSGPSENDTESPRTQIRATPVPPPVAAPSSSGPTFTPYTVKPALRDAAGVSQALQRNYPPLLRDAGIGGTASIWFHISATGSVEDVRIAQSSGFDALDEAALRVARGMTFDPAVNRDRAVEVWVQIPITFSSK